MEYLLKMRLGIAVYINTRIRVSPTFIRPCQSFCKSIVDWGEKKGEGTSSTFARNSQITDQGLWVD